MKERKQISLFYPFVSEEMRKAVYNALGEKNLTQGETVNQFEKLLNRTLGTKNLLTVNSCTSALELAFHLLGLKPGDEVISPVMTFAGANTPLVRRGVTIVFADIKDNLLLDWRDAERKVTKKTKAIVNAHLFDQLNETRDLGIPVVGDAAQYLGKTSGERFTAYSFQAVKQLTTVDGGALVCETNEDYKRAKLLRWFGIDRESGKSNTDVDILEAGYKFHMNNVTAAMGVAGIKVLSKLKKQRLLLQKRYKENLKNVPRLTVIGGSPFLIHTQNREKLIKKLALCGVEAGLNLRRNDLYSIYGGTRQNVPNMNRLESMYVLLPCHNHMTIKDVDFISSTIEKYN